MQDHCREHRAHPPGNRTEDHAVERPAPVPGGETVEYTCPMHPEIVRPGPGSCPICGMDLEPVRVTEDEGPSPELRSARLTTKPTPPIPAFSYHEDQRKLEHPEQGRRAHHRQ